MSVSPPATKSSEPQTADSGSERDAVIALSESSETSARNPDRRPEPAALWLRRTDQLVVRSLATLLVVLLGIQSARLSGWGRDPIELSSQQPREYHYSLDINTASWVEWAQLDGIGQKLARRIVADREERGPFRSPQDVGRVRGIGPKLLPRLLPYLRGGTDPQDRSK